MSAESERVFKVVLTGFGPFEDVEVNESWLAVSGLWELEWPARIKLVTREMPVVYDIVKAEVEKLWLEEKPDLIIHCGVSRGSGCICLEKRAFNTDYSIEDVQGKCPESLICVPGGKATRTTKLDVERICKIVNNKFNNRSEQCNNTCDSSTDPGRYLCGYTYYLSLSKDNRKSLFVHVPSEESIPVKQMSLALKQIIYEALHDLYHVKFE